MRLGVFSFCAPVFPQLSLLRAPFARLQSRRWECSGELAKNLKSKIDDLPKKNPERSAPGAVEGCCLNLGSFNRAAGVSGGTGRHLVGPLKANYEVTYRRL